MNEWVENSLREAVCLLAKAGRNDLASDLNRLLSNLEFKDFEILRTIGADELADGIVEIDSIPELIDVLNKVARLLQVDHCTLHVVSDSQSMNFRTKVMTTYPEEWISRYVERRYSFVDPVAAACAERSHGFYWDSLVVSSPVARSFQDDADAFGIGPAGYSMPIRTETGDIVAVTVSSTDSADDFYGRFHRYESDLSTLGHLLIDAFCRLLSDHRPLSINLTDDQVMVLRQVAVGATESELHDLHFQYGSYATIEKSIRELFRARTMSQAAVLAGRIGLLDHAPLTKSDVLAASEKCAAGRIVAAPNQASLRRLVRMRNVRQAGDGENVVSLAGSAA